MTTLSTTSPLTYPIISKSKLNAFNIQFNDAMRQNNIDNVLDTLNSVIQFNTEDLTEINNYKQKGDLNNKLDTVNAMLKDISVNMNTYQTFEQQRNEKLKINKEKNTQIELSYMTYLVLSIVIFLVEVSVIIFT